MAINFWKFDKDLLNNNKDESRTGLILPTLTHQGEITLVRVMWPVPISQRRKFTSWPLISESLKKICSITTKMNPGQKKPDGRTFARLDTYWVFLLFEKVWYTQQRTIGKSCWVYGMNGMLCHLLFSIPNKYPIVSADAHTDGQTDGDHYHIPPTPSGGGITPANFIDSTVWGGL